MVYGRKDLQVQAILDTGVATCLHTHRLWCAAIKYAVPSNWRLRRSEAQCTYGRRSVRDRAPSKDGLAGKAHDPKRAAHVAAVRGNSRWCLCKAVSGANKQRCCHEKHFSQ
jgi:hypothetical protein